MKLIVIILSYNVHYFLEFYLKSVQETVKNIDAEIIVVVNNSEVIFDANVNLQTDYII